MTILVTCVPSHLILGNQILHVDRGFFELLNVHPLASVPMQVGFLVEHYVKLLDKPFENVRDCSVVSDNGCSPRNKLLILGVDLELKFTCLFQLGVLRTTRWLRC